MDQDVAPHYRVKSGRNDGEQVGVRLGSACSHPLAGSGVSFVESGKQALQFDRSDGQKSHG